MSALRSGTAPNTTKTIDATLHLHRQLNELRQNVLLCRLKGLKLANTFSPACSARCDEAISKDDPHSLKQAITDEGASRGWGGNFWIDSEVTLGNGDIESLLMEVGQRGAVQCMQMVTANIFSVASWDALSPDVNATLIRLFSKSILRLYAFHLARIRLPKNAPPTSSQLDALKVLDEGISAIAANFFSKNTGSDNDLQLDLDQLRGFVPDVLDPALLRGAQMAYTRVGAAAMDEVALKPLPAGTNRPRL